MSAKCNPVLARPDAVGRRAFLKSAGAGLVGLAAGCGRLRGPEESAEVLVLGAGLAGLAAARVLTQAGRDVLVVEARERVGGRAHTQLDLPDRPEFGAVEVGDSYRRVRALAEIFGLTIKPRDFSRPQPLTLHVNGETIHAQDWPEASANRLVDGERALLPGRVESWYLGRSNPLARASDWDTAALLAEDVSISDALRRAGASEEAVRLVNVAGNHNHSDAVSALPAWQRLLAFRSETGVGHIIEGTSVLATRMARALSARIRLGQPLVSLALDSGGVLAHGADGSRFRARHCICTLPLPALGQMQWDAPLDPRLLRAIQEMRYTRVTVALFDADPFWEEDGLPGSMWTDTPLERLFPRLAPDGKTCIGFKAFVNGAGAEALDKLEEAEFERVALATLKRIRPASSGRVRYLMRHRWSEDPYAGGAYAAWPPGRVALFRAGLRETAGPVHFAGEHTALDAPGMEGAVRSGERAARALVASRARPSHHGRRQKSPP